MGQVYGALAQSDVYGVLTSSEIYGVTARGRVYGVPVTGSGLRGLRHRVGFTGSP